MDHWKAELNSSVFRRVLNDLSELASRVIGLRLFQTVWHAETEATSSCRRPPERNPNVSEIIVQCTKM